MDGSSNALRRRTPLVVRETENAGHLDLLGDSCLMLTRVATRIRTSTREWLAPHLHELAGTLSDLSADPDDPAPRQDAVSRTLRTAQSLAHDPSVHGSLTPESPEEATVIVTRIVAADIMIFSGIEPAQAIDAVHRRRQ